MTNAEQMMHRGIEQGKLEEKIHMAKKLLAEGMEPAFAAKISELSLAQIKKLKTIR